MGLIKVLFFISFVSLGFHSNAYTPSYVYSDNFENGFYKTTEFWSDDRQKIIGSIPFGTKLEILAEESYWSLVWLKNRSVWILSKNLSNEKPFHPADFFKDNQEDIGSELMSNSDYLYLKKNLIDTDVCGYGRYSSSISRSWGYPCIANHYLYLGEYKKALIWYLKSKNFTEGSYSTELNNIKVKIGRDDFREISKLYESGKIKLRNIDEWAEDKNYNTNTFQFGGDKNYETKRQVDSIVADIKSPEIYLNQSIFLTVNESQVQLSGIIKDSSKISELTIFGSSVPINKSGKFNTTLYVPLGKSNITIEAIDIFGNKSGRVVTVVRNKAVVKNTAKRLIPPTVMMNSNPNAVALIIGVDKYESITSAPWAESDAGSFYDYAQNALGISADRIRLITGSDSSEAGIWKSVERWLPTVVDRNKSDVYLYFAGHGLASADGNNAYLIPWDGDPDLLERTSILRSELIDGLKDLNAANVTLFMDTCYSGKARGGKGTLVADSRGLRIVKKDTLYNLPNNFTLFAAAANDETASSHPSLKHGLFSYWMMRGLGGDADSNGDRKITNGELHAFINKNVQKSAVSMGRKQHSQLVGDKDKVIASW
jgi:hypothetical protein